MSYDEKIDKFPFAKEVQNRFHRWTGLKDPEVDEALKDLTGDTYFEMRLLIRRTMDLVEEYTRSGRYSGYLKGVKLTDSQRSNINRLDEDLKSELKGLMEDAWRSVLNKQKIGVDKLGLALKTKIKPSYEEDQENSSG